MRNIPLAWRGPLSVPSAFSPRLLFLSGSCLFHLWRVAFFRHSSALSSPSLFQLQVRLRVVSLREHTTYESHVDRNATKYVRNPYFVFTASYPFGRKGGARSPQPPGTLTSPSINSNSVMIHVAEEGSRRVGDMTGAEIDQCVLGECNRSR